MQHPSQLSAQTAATSLPGTRHSVSLPGGGTITLYESGSSGARQTGVKPLLLVHSVNATASAFEMGPVALRQSAKRPVFALDLPGFGLSQKPAAHYTPQRMREAIDAAIDWIGTYVTPEPVDLMALSLGCEFAAEAVLRRPARVRSLALISPTGMEGKRTDEPYEGGRTRDQAWLHRLLRETPLGSALFRLLTTQPVMRRFLARSWGTSKFDRRLLIHGRVCATLPGASHAPLDFVSGCLFTRGIIQRYRALPVPVWVVHGNKGSFTDFEACPVQPGERASMFWRTVIDGGAMPQYQSADAFDAAYESFLSSLRPAAIKRELPTQSAREWEPEFAAELRHGR